jgi:methylthioribulose-1-phosphate dehydratase
MDSKLELVKIGRAFAAKNWSTATSSNYSVRTSAQEILITRSGIDKTELEAEDLITIDLSGRVVSPSGAKSSAETLIHTAIYDYFPKANCVLHTHSVFGTRLSLRTVDQGRISLSGYEMLKGLAGNVSHETIETVPVLPNSQDIPAFSKKLPAVFKENPGVHGFLIAGHGLYSWGTTPAEAKRHIETFEFLFECLAYETLGL